MEQNKLVQRKANRLAIFLILGVILIAIAAMFFYFQHRNSEATRSLLPNPPKLFSKGDYKVEDRADGKYIVVDKVGLTAKVPPTWRVEFEGQDNLDGTSQYWVNLLSPDAEIIDILTKGCGISILSGVSEENFNETKNNIKIIQDDPQNANSIRAGYSYSIGNFGKNIALKWNSLEKPVIGQVFGVDFPMQKNYVFSLESRILPEFKDKCYSVWESFLANVTIK